MTSCVAVSTVSTRIVAADHAVAGSKESQRSTIGANVGVTVAWAYAPNTRLERVMPICDAADVPVQRRRRLHVREQPAREHVAVLGEAPDAAAPYAHRAELRGDVEGIRQNQQSDDDVGGQGYYFTLRP